MGALLDLHIGFGYVLSHDTQAEKLQAADEDHHVKAHLLPHVKDDEEGDRVLHVGKPAYIFKAKKGKEFGRGPILDEEVHEKDGNRH